MGEIPLYSAKYQDRPFAIFPAVVSAAFVAALFEEVIARGGRKFVVCGGAGVLDKTIASGDIVVPTSAIRDEGTSYHYLPASREVDPTPRVVSLVAVPGG
jgi:uridine phosphorylase